MLNSPIKISIIALLSYLMVFPGHLMAWEGTPYTLPSGTYIPPSDTYTPPSDTYTPRTYTPPSGTYTPPVPSIIMPPNTRPTTNPVLPGDTVLGAVSSGQSPVFACNALLKKTDLTRYNNLSSDLGIFLPTKRLNDTLNPDLKQVTPPVMEGVTQCQNAKKNSCMKLLGESLSNPEQLSYNSSCTPDVLAKYEELIKKNPLPPPALNSPGDLVATLDGTYERDEALSDIYNEHAQCDNQAGIVMEIIGALDGNPTSKLGHVDSNVLMDMLKKVSPSAHHAVECLVESKSGNIGLGGTKGAKGEVIGTLTGVVYSEGFNKEGALWAACVAGPIACGVGVAATAIGLWTGYSSHRSANCSERSVDDADEQWKYTQGFDSKYGVKDGCDGNGRCNVNTPGSISEGDDKGPSTTPSDDSTKPDTSKPSAGSTTTTQPDPFATPKLPTDRIEPGDANYSPDVDSKAPEKLNKDNSGHHYGEDAEHDICEKVYSGQTPISRKTSGISSRTSWTQESLEERVKGSEPIDFTNDADLYGTPDAACSSMTYDGGL
jgi:hypothetical protein